MADSKKTALLAYRALKSSLGSGKNGPRIMHDVKKYLSALGRDDLADDVIKGRLKPKVVMSQLERDYKI